MKFILPTIAAFILFNSFIGVVLGSGNFSPWVDEAIRLVNEERDRYGLLPLQPNEKLERAAAAKIADMEKGKYFAHTSPSGATPWTWVELSGYDYRYAGENLAIHFKNPRDEHTSWMESEKHCQNILDPRFQEIGMAVKKVFFDGRETMLTVQMFGTRIGKEDATSKDVAVAICRSGVPIVSGESVFKSDTASNGIGIIGFVQSIRIPEDTIRLGQVVALSLFALSELLAVILIFGSLFRREWKEGVI